MPIVWDDRLKKNIMDIGGALNPRWGRALAAGVDLFENVFIDEEFIQYHREERYMPDLQCPQYHAAEQDPYRIHKNPDIQGAWLFWGRNREGI